MCFSIKISVPKKKYISNYPVTNLIELDPITFRAFPHQNFPVILSDSKGLKFQIMNYSLIPSWSKTAKPKFATYNARIETIDEKPTWIKPLEKTRCLVGITSFFESCYEGTHQGNIVEFFSDEVITLAGVYNTWINKETGEIVDSFAIVTKEPYSFVKKTGHDRSPISLDKNSWDTWLDPELNKIKDVKEFLLDQKNIPSLDVKIERPLKQKSKL